MKILRAARALAKIKAITKPPKKHSRACGFQFFTKSFQNIQLTGCVCGLHAFYYNPVVFHLATRNPEIPMTHSFSQAATVRLLLVLILAVFASPALAQPESRIYELNNRSADDMARQVRDLYQGEQITVSARNQQLVIRGEPRLLDEIGQLVESIDVAPVQMRVTIRYRQDIGGKESGGGVSASSNEARANLRHNTISTNATRQRHLVVQDGQSAHITSGNVRTLPFAIQGGRNPAAVLKQVETRSGFVVSPHSISDQTVELTIVSFEEDPAAIEGYETEALVTIRRVNPGQWVSLGGTRSSQNSQKQGITYRVNNSRTENQTVEVKVEILP